MSEPSDTKKTSAAPRKEEPPNDDIGRSVKAAAILGGVLSAFALGLYGSRCALSVLIGATIAVANLLTMRAIIRAVMQAPPEAESSDETSADRDPKKDHKAAGRRGGMAWGVFAVLKIFVLFGGVWILLTKELVDPMPLVVGYGVLPLGIALSAVFGSLRPR